MQVHRHLHQLPLFTNAVVTIGNFDGVHRGHQQILQQLKSEANAVDGETVIITFDPHPRRILGSQSLEICLLNTLSEKIELLEAAGIDHLVVVPFTSEFASLPAVDYVEKFLVENFHPHTIIIGYDHRFGHLRQGNYQLLASLKDRFGYQVKEISEQVMRNLIISSSKIRQAVLNGHTEEANELLGYPYHFEGSVVEGNRLGRTIGYPTANILVDDADKLIPAHGVYAVTVKIEHQQQSYSCKGMMNIGVRPTINGSHRTIEVNIFDFEKDIYGGAIRVYVHQWLRGEAKFSGLPALKEQLAKDREMAMEVLKNIA